MFMSSETINPVIKSAADASEQLQLVTFEVGQEEFAIDILSVQEINRMMTITRVPQSPECLEGVINLRGRIIPVVDLRKRFNLENREHNSDSRIIVVEVSGRVLGFIVDRVNEVLRVDGSIVEPAPELATGSHSDYVRGVGKLEDRLLILLDLNRLFSVEELTGADQTAKAA
jgi:purine-binding chemotaxis protein CheW